MHDHDMSRLHSRAVANRFPAQGVTIDWRSLTFRQRCGLIVSLLGLVALANAFGVTFIRQEQYIYSWDWGGYWVSYADMASLLLHDPANGLRRFFESVRSYDYNFLPILPLAPIEWIFGFDRLAYVLAITNLYLLPSAMLLALLSWRSQVAHHEEPQKATPLVLAVGCIMILHPLWVPVLRGLPDALGLVFVAAILLFHFRKPLDQQTMVHAALTGLLLCLLVLTRRWYMFWVVAFFPAHVVAQGADLYRRGAHRGEWLRAGRNVFVIGIVLTGSFAIVATPLLLRIARTDYSDIYSAYRFTTSVLESMQQLVWYFGWGVLVCASCGVGWLIAHSRTRTLGTFLLVQLLIIFLHFSSVQDFNVQHVYLLIPTIGAGVATLVIALWTRISVWPWRVAAVGSVFLTLFASFSITFHAPLSPHLDKASTFLPTGPRFFPLVRNDIGEVNRLLDRLEDLDSDIEHIYVLASSHLMNPDVLRNACRFGEKERSICDRFLVIHDVDKRDGFPTSFLKASHVVLTAPTQYHLRPVDQRSVGLLADKMASAAGVGRSFSRLPDVFELDGGVVATIFVKTQPLANGDVDALRVELGHHPVTGDH